MVARLESDEEQRRTLLADVSHELRTPLAVITGNLEAIIDGVYPADAAHLTPILDETRVLARLIDDLRTLALSEAGTLALHPEPTDPDLLVAEVVRSFERRPRPRPASRSSAEIDGDLPILDLDPVRIREVLSNLVANALRHTPAGGTVTIAWRAPRPSTVVLDGRATRARDRAGAPAPRVRPVREGRRVARVGARARDRPRARGGPRRDDLGRVAGRWRDHVPVVLPLPRAYGRLIRTSSTAASTVLRAARVGGLEDDPDLLAGPRRHRDRDRRPRRLVGVGGALLLLARACACRPPPRRRPGSSRRTTSSSCARGSSGTSARPVGGRQRDRRASGPRSRRRRGRRTVARRAGRRARDERVRARTGRCPPAGRSCDGLPRCHAPRGGGVGVERVDVPAARRLEVVEQRSAVGLRSCR